MKYEILVTEKAEEDLKSIADYLIYVLLAGENALKQIARIEHAIKTLEEMPERCKIYDKEPWRTRKLRFLRVDSYMLFYIVEKNKNSVIILRIMYGRRDIKNTLSLDTL